MEPKNKINIILLAVVLALTGAVLIFTAVDSPPLTAPVIAYVPPAVSYSENVKPNTESIPEDENSTAATPESKVNNITEEPLKMNSKAVSSKNAPVSSVPEQTSTPSKSASAAAAEIRINLNTATVDELMQLTSLKIGIGEATVMSIYDYREYYGNFAHTEDLLKISGIGEKKYLKLLPYVYVE